MVDVFYTFTRSAETAIGGAFGGLLYSVANKGSLALTDLGVFVGAFLSLAVLITALHAWYEKRAGEKFR